MLTLALLIVTAYLIGSIPFAFYVAKATKGIDIREHGSGNVGATNVLRVCGKPAGALAYALDFLKGLLPVGLIAQSTALGSVFPQLPQGLASLGLEPWHAALVAIAILVGHSRSIFLGFHGGKSAMSGLASVIAVAPLGGLVTGVLAVSIIFLTRTVSIGSLFAAVSAWAIVWLSGAPMYAVLYTAAAGALVLLRHRSNIQRLLSGQENRFVKETSSS